MKVKPPKKFEGDYTSIPWEEEYFTGRIDVLEPWPDLKQCVRRYYAVLLERTNLVPDQPPVAFDCSRSFLKAVDRYCQTGEEKLRLLDAVTKKVYNIPSSGLKDRPIREKPGLWHFYVSDYWRVYYRVKASLIRLERFCGHPKTHN